MVRPRRTCLSGWDNHLAFLAPRPSGSLHIAATAPSTSGPKGPQPSKIRGWSSGPGQVTASSVSQIANGKSQGIKHATVRFID